MPSSSWLPGYSSAPAASTPNAAAPSKRWLPGYEDTNVQKPKSESDIDKLYKQYASLPQQNPPIDISPSSVGQGVSDVGHSLWNMVTHPIDTAQGIIRSHGNAITRAQQAWSAGDPAETLLQGASAFVPGGPAAVQMGETAGSGHVGRAIGQALASYVAGEALPGAVRGAGEATAPVARSVAPTVGKIAAGLTKGVQKVSAAPPTASELTAAAAAPLVKAIPVIGPYAAGVLAKQGLGRTFGNFKQGMIEAFAPTEATAPTPEVAPAPVTLAASPEALAASARQQTMRQAAEQEFVPVAPPKNPVRATEVAPAQAPSTPETPLDPNIGNQAELGITGPEATNRTNVVERAVPELLKRGVTLSHFATPEGRTAVADMLSEIPGISKNKALAKSGKAYRPSERSMTGLEQLLGSWDEIANVRGRPTVADLLKQGKAAKLKTIEDYLPETSDTE